MSMTKGSLQKLGKIHDNIGRKLVGGSSTVAEAVLRRNLGWRKLKERREEN